MNRPDPTPRVSTLSGPSLADMPLRSGEESYPSAFREESAPAIESLLPAAGLGARAGAFGADVATILLLAIATILAAQVLTGELPFAAGVVWIGAFLLLLSFSVTVPPLVLFGRTMGMALAGLTARRGTAGRRLLAGEAVRRWLGTLTALATLGLALLFTLGSGNAPTPADRWSGRPLEESRDG